MLGAGPQDKIHHFVAEIFRVADPGRLFNLFQFIIESGTIKDFSGIRITKLLVLNPEIGVGDIAVKDILTILRVAFEVGSLNFLTDEFGVMRTEKLLQKAQIALLDLGRILLLLNLLFKHVHQVHRIGRHLTMIKVEDTRQYLESKTGG